jgi:hypothetical protein
VDADRYQLRKGIHLKVCRMDKLAARELIGKNPNNVALLWELRSHAEHLPRSR